MPDQISPSTEAQLWQEKYARALADYQNLLKQHQKDRQEYLKFANQTLISQLLPIFDSLELAARHSSDQGINMISKQLKTLIENEGVMFISPLQGEVFNPQIHECVEIDPDPQGQPETVAKLIQVGAAWQDASVIRPAKVIVFRINSDPKIPVDSH